MSTNSNRRLSNLTFFSGAAFLFSSFCYLIVGAGLAREIFGTIWFWSIPVLLIALVLDVCRKRYWALALLVLLVASLVLLFLAIRAVAQGICCG